jgi:hypothetical protein
MSFRANIHFTIPLLKPIPLMFTPDTIIYPHKNSYYISNPFHFTWNATSKAWFMISDFVFLCSAFPKWSPFNIAVNILLVISWMKRTSCSVCMHISANSGPWHFPSDFTQWKPVTVRDITPRLSLAFCHWLGTNGPSPITNMSLLSNESPL